MSNEVSQRVLELAADSFGEKAESMSEATSPDDFESWDSLAHLNLVMAIEDEFRIEIAPDSISDLRTLGDIISLVRSMLI
jgi:acyl carrier protein